MTKEQFVSLYLRIDAFMSSRDWRELDIAFPDEHERDIVTEIADRCRSGTGIIRCARCTNLRKYPHDCGLKVVGECKSFVPKEYKES